MACLWDVMRAKKCASMIVHRIFFDDDNGCCQGIRFIPHGLWEIG